MYGGSDSEWWVFLFVVVCIGVAIGVGITLFVPWLWGVMKPIIHAMTI